MPPVSWVPGGGVLRRGTPIQNRGGEEEEREEERERGCSLCTRERLFAKEQRGTGGWWQKERRQSRASKNNRLANKGSTAITNLSTRASNSFRTRFRSPGWGEKSLTRCTRVATLADARSCLADFFRPLHRIFPRFGTRWTILERERKISFFEEI